MKKLFLITTILTAIILTSCKTTKQADSNATAKKPKDSITLLFAGDIMAHNVNYKMKDYNCIWDGVKKEITDADLAFGNIEAPVDATKEPESYPYFNMPVSYVQAAIDAGFDVFSLCNNHSNDQKLDGIKHTLETVNKLTQNEKEKGNNIYFSGLKPNEKDTFTYNIIEVNGWKILFLPMTEILNKPTASGYINYINSSTEKRNDFINFCAELRKNNPCDLFILSWHANETEYIRTVTKRQEQFYNDLLEAGIDVIWANHAHIIKDRKIINYKESGTSKIIMYANGNTISGQRSTPDFKVGNPIGERDNTGDGLFYKVTFYKEKKSSAPKIFETQSIFITTYVTPKRDYIVRLLDESFIKELEQNSQKKWADYLRKRLKINNEYTKEIIEWR